MNFKFLCGNFEGLSYIYGITNDETEWKYFNETDVEIQRHPKFIIDKLGGKIQNLSKVATLTAKLNDEEVQSYYDIKKKYLNLMVLNLKIVSIKD
jgi:hypothetical protein